jgi:hypothetical protein
MKPSAKKAMDNRTMQAHSLSHRASALLDDCQEIVLSSMQDALARFFENSYEAFHEFSGKAQSGSAQIRFMEAMSMIARNRSRVEAVFLDHIRRSFAAFNGSHPSGNTSTVADRRLSLISREESDIQVAIQNMIESAAVGSSHTLHAIRQRLSVLNQGRKVAEDAVPGGPACLAHAFHAAVNDLPLEHESRLVVYFLYDRVVLRKTRILYDEYNRHLLEAGILPNLIYEVRRNPSQSGRGARHPEHAEDSSRAAAQPRNTDPAGPSLADAVFQDILELLSRRDRNNMDSNRGHSSGAGPVQPLPRSDLVSALTDLQRSSRDYPEHDSNEAADPGAGHQHEHSVAHMVSRLSAERERLFNGLDRRRLPSADIQLIDLVGMMFEYMLRDEDIPSVAKAELSRLHTPYLKVAIIDKSLFSDTSHPAHVLLNSLADAATKWVFADNLERGVFPCLCHIVQRIIDEFDHQLDIFDELLAFLANSVRNLEERAAVIEERSRQAAAGKEKLALARTCAAQAIESRLTGHHVPAALPGLLNDIWLDKLMFIYLREPEMDGSPAWKLAIQAIESIVWSATPRKTTAERNELRQRLPDLRKQLADVMDTLAVYGNSELTTQLKLLQNLQDAAATNAAPGPDTTHSHEQGTTRETVAVAAVTVVPAIEPVTDKTTPDSVELTAAEEQALELLKKIRFGTWFSFEGNDQEPARLVKLSWFSGVSGNYMFVDSMGVRAITRKHHELAAALASGKVRIIDDNQPPLIQRALQTIRRLLGGTAQ